MSPSYFDHKSAAKRYRDARPYFHPVVISRIKAFLGIDRPVGTALDVACGTGQSSIALREVATRIVAIDRSPEMIALAELDEKIIHNVASADDIPIDGDCVDLITVACAFHWFDRPPFLAEARRVLRQSSPMVIYNNMFTGNMKENPKFHDWIHGTHLKRYPSPPRNMTPFTEEEAQEEGFLLLGSEKYENDVTFTSSHLIEYLLTQTNVIAAVEEGKESLESVSAWLDSEVPAYFPLKEATFEFRGPIDYYRKA